MPYSSANRDDSFSLAQLPGASLTANLLEIPEYWIVDPLAQAVTVCVFEEGEYSDRRFIADELIKSAVFSELSLTAKQILSASR